jgi:hypothetical protein
MIDLHALFLEMKRLGISAIPSMAQRSKQFEIALRTYTACQAKIVRRGTVNTFMDTLQIMREMIIPLMLPAP